MRAQPSAKSGGGKVESAQSVKSAKSAKKDVSRGSWNVHEDKEVSKSETFSEVDWKTSRSEALGSEADPKSLYGDAWSYSSKGSNRRSQRYW